MSRVRGDTCTGRRCRGVQVSNRLSHFEIALLAEKRSLAMTHESKGRKNMEKDPVCGMMVDPGTAAGKSEYNGKTYYFCAPGCKKDFDKDPGKYVGEAGKSARGESH
jgi:YHS domain-containing protein